MHSAGEGSQPTVLREVNHQVHGLADPEVGLANLKKRTRAQFARD